MEKEKIIVARNSEPENSPSQYLGVEVSIGSLTNNELIKLKDQHKSNTFFKKREGMWGDSYIGSSWLTELMERNEFYNKTGLIFYEDLDEANDEEILGPTSTDNWVFACDWWDWTQEKNLLPTDVNIPQDGIVVVNIRTQDFYFKAKGELSIDNKKSNADEGIENKFIVQAGIDKIFIEGFCYFNILHSVFVNGEELNNEDSYEDSIYYSSHLIFKDGNIIAWLGSNNNSHTFPLDYITSNLPCISPYLKENNPETYDAAVKSLLEKL
jgi:hypothetical protein